MVDSMTIPEQFYTADNKKITRDKIVNEWIDNYINNTDGKLTDFTEGSEIRNILESFALSIYTLEYYKMLEYRQHWLIYASGSYLDLKGTEFNLPRKQGSFAMGYVTITLPEVATEDITINDGVSFINPTTNIVYEQYRTIDQIQNNHQYTIPRGSISVEIPVVCSIMGSIGNTGKGTVNSYYSEPTMDSTVCINTEAITGGTDIESNDDYRSRLLARERQGSFGNRYWYQNICNSIEGVHDSYVTFGSESVQVFVNGNGKPINPTILAICLSELNKEQNHLLGHNFKIYEPDYYDLNLKIEINGDNIISENNIVSRLQALIDGGTDDDMSFMGYSLGESLNENDIISALTALNGVTSVTPYIANKAGEYSRFKSLVCQSNQVFRIIDIVVEIREE